MQFLGVRCPSLVLAALCASIVVFATPSAAITESVGQEAQNKAWAARMVDLLKLSPAQQAALQGFIATSAKSTQLNGATAEQIRAMTMLDRFDYMAAHFAQVDGAAKAEADALHRFYASLSVDQRKQFDDATRPRQQNPSVAADVISAPAREEPDYSLPAHVEADWLIKPTAENISRAYPSQALREHLAGKVLLSCAVDEDGYLADCLVRSESPKDRGFGNAALEMTAYMRMQPATNYGVPVRGFVTLPLTFNPEEE